MTKLVLFTLICMGSSALAAPDIFSGQWQSDSGWLAVELQAKKLTLVECWRVEGKKKCQTSEYDSDGSRLYIRGKRVGEIFPWQIIIFEGNSQVSEQMVLQEAPDGQMTSVTPTPTLMGNRCGAGPCLAG
jgi:hypothetical protein